MLSVRAAERFLSAGAERPYQVEFEVEAERGRRRKFAEKPVKKIRSDEVNARILILRLELQK